MAEATSTTVCSQKVEIPAAWPTGWPSMLIRKVPSGRQPESTKAPRSHRFCIPEAHQRHRPQPGRNDITTWSPTDQPGVLGPTASTMPEPSWPPAKGRMPGGRSPVHMWSSEWHRPEAASFSSSSPWRGSSRSISAISHCPGDLVITAPRVFIGVSLAVLVCPMA